MPSRLTQGEFLARIAESGLDVTVLEEYHGHDKRIRTLCNVCGNVWEPLAGALIRGHGCPKCAFKRNGLKRRLTQEEFVARAAAAAPHVTVIGEYASLTAPVSVRCKVCGHEWKPIAASLLAAQRCPACSEERRQRLEEERARAAESRLPHHKTHERFLSDLAKANPAIKEVLSVYQGSGRPITVRCPHCGGPWTTTPSVLFTGASSCGCHQYAAVSRNLTDNMAYVDGTVIERTLRNICGKPWKTNSSGVTGVTKSRGGWQASMEFRGEIHFLGRFRNVEEAAQARWAFEDDEVIPFLLDYYESHGLAVPECLQRRIAEGPRRYPS